jgi:hypothetical protein
MNPSLRHFLRRVCGCMAALLLVSCGGGSESPAEAVSQTLNFVSPGDQVFGAAPPPLVATASSGLAVRISSTTPGVCTVSGSTLTLTAAGTCTLTAEQAGDATYAAAVPVSHSFAVAPGAQSITFVSPGNQTLGVDPSPLVASASSGLAVAFESTSPEVCAVSGSTLSLLAAGTCTLEARQAGNANYEAAAAVSHSFSVIVELLAQGIDFPAPANQTLGTAPPALAATAGSGLPVSFASLTPGVCTVSGTTVTLVAAGTCTVAASQAGDAVYAAAAAVMRSFTVEGAAQSISFASPGDQVLGTAPPALVATASSGLAVTLVSATPGVCLVNETTVTLVSAGTCTLNAVQAGNGFFAAAATVTRSFTVAPPPLVAQTISFSAPGNQTLGTAPPALMATASSGLPVSFTSGTPGVCTVSGTTLTLVAVGSCTVNANQAGNATYAAAPTVSRSFTVAAAPLIAQTITFASPGNQTLGTAPPALTATASSGLPVSFTSGTPGVCTVSGTTLTLVAVGSCIIEANQAGNATYAAAPTVSRSFTVAAAPLIAQTITFASPGNQTLGTAPPALTATASSGLPVSFTSGTPGVCTVSGTTLTLVAVGSCIIEASQAGNATYAAAPTVSRSFTVAAAPLIAQTITFASPGNQTLGTAPPALVATATSGLPVSFASSTPTICTVSGTALTLVAVGTCTIDANQAGSALYAAAATVSRSFTVAPAPIELFANGGFETAGLSTPAEAWLAAASGYARSTDARSGTYAARLSSPAFSSAVMVQNSIEQGSRPALTVGSSPTLSFWAKGTAGATGNVLFALRYLDGVGNIKANSMNQFFQGQINPNTWTRITFNLGPVPAGSVAAFIEFAQNIGPIGTGPAGENWFAGDVLIDDLSLRVEN